MSDVPKPSPVGWFFTTRKGLLTSFSGLVAAVFVALVALKIAQDKMTLEVGFGFITGGLFAWFLLVFKAMDAIEKEDNAKRALESAKSSEASVASAGSKFEIRIDKADQDPDRIIAAMFKALGKNAPAPKEPPPG